MDINQTRAHKLKLLIKEKFSGKISLMADSADMKASVISRFFMASTNQNARNIGEKAARKIESNLNLRRGYLDTIENPAQSVNEPAPLYNVQPSKQIPLISSVTAGQWGEISDNFEPNQAESWITTTAKVSDKAFALKIQGDSMEPLIHDGDTIIVDPNRQATHKSIVVVRQNGNTEATCKRLIIEGDNYYLQPENTRYPIMQMEKDAVICGVATDLSKSLT